MCRAGITGDLERSLLRLATLVSGEATDRRTVAGKGSGRQVGGAAGAATSACSARRGLMTRYAVRAHRLTTAAQCPALLDRGNTGALYLPFG
jgi:hypothetical protein